MNIANDITQLVGNTPIIKLKNSNIYAKCEFMNPNGSVKDRIGAFLIKQALKDGTINKNSTIIEPTSGNTGIALASVCASLGIKLILTMPESMSIERRKLLKAYGAKLVLTSADEGMSGSIKKANELKEEIDGGVILGQFENPNNPLAHELTTAKEILNDMDKNIDIFITAVGTGGTLAELQKG